MIEHSDAAATFTRREIALGERLIEIGELGEGPVVLLLPGAGGSGTEQYERLGGALAGSGFRAVAVNFRGVGTSTGALDNLSLHDFADDVAALVDACGEPAHLVGRAFGNRIARCAAMDYPARVRSVTLIAAGGMYPPRNQGVSKSDTTRAPASTIWREAAQAQLAAGRATALQDWWSGGVAPMLVIQGLKDRIAVPENGRQLARAYASRVRLVEIADAGHQLLFEQPERVIAPLLEFLLRLESANVR